jgi:hypothetical protein
MRALFQQVTKTTGFETFAKAHRQISTQLIDRDLHDQFWGFGRNLVSSGGLTGEWGSKHG